MSYAVRVKSKKKPVRAVKVLGFEAEPALEQTLNKLAEEQDRSRSWVIRSLLLRALAANEKTA